MLQDLTLSTTQDWVVVVSVRCLNADFATMQAELTHLTGEATNWVGGSASS